MTTNQTKLIKFSKRLLKLAPAIANKGTCTGMIGEPKLPAKFKKS